MMRVLGYYVIVSAAAVCCLGASPKKYVSDEGGFQPSNRYYESNLPSFERNYNATTKAAESKEGKDHYDRLRFGIPITTSFGNTGNGVGYPNNNGVNYMISPMKIDIGGIALGALIGLGAVLIVPKLAHAISGGYGYRSLENDMSAITDVLARIDNSLEQQNIDSSSCMQRFICNYVVDAQKNMQTGEANTVDQLIYTVSNNSLFSYMLDGTAIKEAVDVGKQGNSEKCSSFYLKCPVNRENIMKIVSNLLPA